MATQSGTCDGLQIGAQKLQLMRRREMEKEERLYVPLTNISHSIAQISTTDRWTDVDKHGRLDYFSNCFFNLTNLNSLVIVCPSLSLQVFLTFMLFFPLLKVFFFLL